MHSIILWEHDGMKGNQERPYYEIENGILAGTKIPKRHLRLRSSKEKLKLGKWSFKFLKSKILKN